jgi:hypothetical protein
LDSLLKFTKLESCCITGIEDNEQLDFAV